MSHFGDAVFAILRKFPGRVGPVKSVQVADLQTWRVCWNMKCCFGQAVHVADTALMKNTPPPFNLAHTAAHTANKGVDPGNLILYRVVIYVF